MQQLAVKSSSLLLLLGRCQNSSTYFFLSQFWVKDFAQLPEEEIAALLSPLGMGIEDVPVY